MVYLFNQLIVPMDTVICNISIEPYLAEFLQSKYGAPVKVPQSHDLNHYLRDVMSKPTVKTDYVKGNLRVYLPFENGGKDPRTFNCISDAGQKVIERKVLTMFNAELHTCVDEHRHNHGWEINESIWYFISKYEIESITFEALKKNYYRWRLSLGKDKNRMKFKRKGVKSTKKSLQHLVATCPTFVL